MSDEAFDASLDLLRRLDPKNTGDNVNALCKLAPSLAESLLSSVDQPLGVKVCKKTNKKYLTCDYNRDGDSHRSPWSGEYEPALSDGPVPSEELRKLEEIANNAFDVYRELYYEGGISSVYLWDQEEDDGFAGVVLLKKEQNEASWDGIHVLEVIRNGRRSATYRCTSTVILDMGLQNEALGNLGLSGNLTRQTERQMNVEKESMHIENIGQIVEEMESKMRNILNEVYFGKTRDIVGDLRSVMTLSERRSEKAAQSEIVKGLGN